MKKIFLMVMYIAFVNFQMMAQNDLFNKLADMPGITSVSISPKMFEMIKGSASVESEKLHFENIAGKLTRLQILSSEDKKASKILRKETGFINPQNGYEELLRVKDDEEKVFIYSKNIKDNENEYILLVDEADEFTVVMFSGKLTLDELRGIMDK